MTNTEAPVPFASLDALADHVLAVRRAGRARCSDDTRDLVRVLSIVFGFTAYGLAVSLVAAWVGMSIASPLLAALAVFAILIVGLVGGVAGMVAALRRSGV